jgi:hypothetical protein
MNARGVRAADVSKCTTWHAAWTPVSVRPEHATSIGSSATNDSARSTVTCSVGSWVWVCQPRKSGAVVFDAESPAHGVS